MIGSSALTCVERAPSRRARRVIRVAEAQPEDVLATGTCARCGFIGEHREPEACIEALRSEIATLEFRLDEKPAKPAVERGSQVLVGAPPQAPPPKPSEVVSSFYEALERGARRS